MYDPVPQMYTVVAEIKSGDDDEKGGGLEQNVEQIKEQQTMMLGLVVHNLRVAPLLLHLVDDELTSHRVAGLITAARRYH